MKSVFITGGSSSLGSHVINLLSGKVRILAATHRNPIPHSGSVELLPDALEKCEKYAQQIRSADVVLHLAALTHSDKTAQYFFNNTELTKRLLKVCRENQRFIFVSSQSAHPDGGAYAHSKWLAEEAIRGSAVDHTIIRASQLYGSKADEGIDRLVTFAWRTRLMLDFRCPEPAVYAPIDVTEAAGFLTRVVLDPVRSRATYVLCAEREVSAQQIAVALRRSTRPIFVVPVSVRLLSVLAAFHFPLPFKPDQLKRLKVRARCDNSLAREDYGFHPRSFLEHLARA